MAKFKQLESFVSVATRGSLTAAAKAEGVAPAIMGRRIDALEERLGVKLLVRTTRRITSPTKAARSWKTASACWRSSPTPKPASARAG